MPQLRDLEYLQTLKLTGSLTRTAELHGISVAAVSKAMRILEEQLQTRLFIRGARSIALSEQGTKLAENAARMHSIWQDTVAELQEYQSTPSGNIRVSVSETYGKIALLPLLPAFREQYPLINLDVRFEDGYASLQEGEVDFLIRVGTLDEQSIIARMIEPLTIRFAATPKFARLHGLPTHPGQIADFPCIGFRLPAGKRLLPFSFYENGSHINIDVRPSLTVNSPDAVLNMILAHQGIGIVNTYMTDHLMEKGKLVPVLDKYLPEQTRGIYLCYLQRKQMPQRFRCFIEFALQTLPQNRVNN